MNEEENNKLYKKAKEIIKQAIDKADTPNDFIDLIIESDEFSFMKAMKPEELWLLITFLKTIEKFQGDEPNE